MPADAHPEGCRCLGCWHTRKKLSIDSCYWRERPMPLCVALKRAMRLQGLSLDAASRMIGAKNVYVMKWMSGQTVPGWAMHSKIHRALGIFAHAEIDSLITREERLAAGRGEIPDFSALTIKRVRWEMPECVRAGQQKYWEMRRKQLEEAEDAEQSSD